MDINLIRLKLATYCCYNYFKGALSKGDEPLSDNEICEILALPVNEWLSVKDEALKDYFISNINGITCLKSHFKNLIRKFNPKRLEDDDVDESKINELILKIRNSKSTRLADHQILIEVFKIMKGFDKQPDWDNLYFKMNLRVAKDVIEKIGLMTGIKVMQWISRSNFKWWTLKSILSLYPSYWKATSKNDGELIKAGKSMFDKYK